MFDTKMTPSNHMSLKFKFSNICIFYEQYFNEYCVKSVTHTENKHKHSAERMENGEHLHQQRTGL